MEKIMSKSNDSSFTVDLGGDATCTGRLLRDDELQTVSGGVKADSNEVAVEGFVSRAFGLSFTDAVRTARE
jgi:hypothetical protein